jgi:hypothetical protein
MICTRSVMEVHRIDYAIRVAILLKQMGFGRSVIERLVKTSIKKNLYYEIKERVVEEAFNGYRVNKNKQLVRIFGIDSTKDVRARLIELLYERVAYHKDKFIARILYDEMGCMEVKKSGKVEHSDTSHDDQVFSYLMAIYVWYDGHNIMENFNIQKNTIKTDEDEEVVSNDIEKQEDKERIDIPDDDDVGQDIQLKESMDYLEDANKAQLASNFQNSISIGDDLSLNMMLATNKVAKAAYNEKYHIDPTNGPTGMVTLPDSAFDLYGDDGSSSPDAENSKNGNLFGQFTSL